MSRRYIWFADYHCSAGSRIAVDAVADVVAPQSDTEIAKAGAGAEIWGSSGDSC